MKASRTIYLHSSHSFKFPRPVNYGKENAIRLRFKLNDNTVIYIVEVLEIYVATPVPYYSKAGEYTLKKYKKPKYVIKSIINNDSELELKLIHQILTTSDLFRTYEAALKVFDEIIDKYNEGNFEINLI